jgi:hypothetical protein
MGFFGIQIIKLLLFYEKPLISLADPGSGGLQEPPVSLENPESLGSVVDLDGLVGAVGQSTT